MTHTTSLSHGPDRRCEVTDVLPPQEEGEVEETTQPTPQQAHAIDLMVRYVQDALDDIRRGHPLRKAVFTFSGIAGAGKTTCASFAIRRIEQACPGIRIAYLGSTHRARIQLAQRLALDLNRDVRTDTVWSAVFLTGNRHFCVKTPKDDTGRHETVLRLERDGACEPCAERGRTQCGCPSFSRCSQSAFHLHCDVDSEPVAKAPRPVFPFGTPDLLYADEGSMMTIEQMDIIKSWGKPLILSGDHAQLGPVHNPRTDPPERAMCVEMQHPDAVLDKPMRQDPDSPLFQVATAYRNGSAVPVGAYGDDVAVLSPADQRITDILLRFTPGPSRVVITPWNQPRAQVNRAVHRRWYGSAALAPGERLAARKGGYGYALSHHQARSLGPGAGSIAVWYRQQDDIERTRRMLEKQILTLLKEINSVLDRHGVQDERSLVRGSEDHQKVTLLREKIADAGSDLKALPASCRQATVKHGFATVVAVESDPQDDRYLYAILRLESPHPWELVHERVAVRLAASQLGAQGTLSESRTPPGAALWDYGYCVTPWAAQGGEWDDVIALGVGWRDVYRRAGYVSASRARQKLVVVGNQYTDQSDILNITRAMVERALRHGA